MSALSENEINLLELLEKHGEKGFHVEDFMKAADMTEPEFRHILGWLTDKNMIGSRGPAKSPIYFLLIYGRKRLEDARERARSMKASRPDEPPEAPPKAVYACDAKLEDGTPCPRTFDNAHARDVHRGRSHQKAPAPSPGPPSSPQGTPAPAAPDPTAEIEPGRLLEERVITPDRSAAAPLPQDLPGARVLRFPDRAEYEAYLQKPPLTWDELTRELPITGAASEGLPDLLRYGAELLERRAADQDQPDRDLQQLLRTHGADLEAEAKKQGYNVQRRMITDDGDNLQVIYFELQMRKGLSVQIEPRNPVEAALRSMGGR